MSLPYGRPADVRRITRYVLMVAVICLVVAGLFFAIDAVTGPPSDPGLASATGVGG